MLLARCNRNTPSFTVDKNPPKTSKELDEIRTNSLSRTEDSSLQKWAEIFGDGGLNLPDLRNMTPEPRALSPPPTRLSELKELPEPPNTKTRFKGKPIDLETAQAMRKILFGCAAYSFTQDWKTFRFLFRDPRSPIPYGIQANSPGTRALALCVQAYVVKHLLFGNAEEEDRPFGRAAPTPNAAEQEIALIDAITDILWKASPPLVRNNQTVEGKRCAAVTLPCDSQCFRTLGYFVADGITEKLWIFTVHTRDDLRTLIKRNLHVFCAKDQPGGILLACSVVMSRTVPAILTDIGRCQDSLLTDSARPTQVKCLGKINARCLTYRCIHFQAFINLLLTGSATCFIHNGVICYDKHGQLLDVPKPGPRVRSEVGFLFFDKSELENHRTVVGCMLRTPLLPIWVTQVNGSYGLLFCTSRDLVADWKTERFFTIHYYNGHFSQREPTNITIDTRQRAMVDPDREISIWDDEEEKERKQPSLERLLATKWPEATLDWNGETPHY